MTEVIHLKPEDDPLIPPDGTVLRTVKPFSLFVASQNLEEALVRNNSTPFNGHMDWKLLPPGEILVYLGNLTITVPNHFLWSYVTSRKPSLLEEVATGKIQVSLRLHMFLQETTKLLWTDHPETFAIRNDPPVSPLWTYLIQDQRLVDIIT